MDRDERLQRQKTMMHRLHRRRIRKGLCPTCGARKGPGTQLCETHAEKDRTRVRKKVMG